MNSPSALEFTPTEEPPRQEGVDDPQARNDGGGGTGPHQGHRFSRRAWPRRAGRRSRRAQAANCECRLSAGEERALAARARAGDADAEQELITANLALVLHAARDYKHRGVPLDDLIQEGNLALVRAARHFDPATHAARFATYANYWIRCFIMRALGTNSLLLQGQGDARSLRLQYREAVAELVARDTAAGAKPDSAPPSIDEVAQYLGVSARRLAEARLARHDQVAHQGLVDLTPTDEPAPDQAVVTDEDRAIVCAALQRLSPFEAWVISERFGLNDPPGRGIRRVSTTRDPQSDSKTTGAPAAGPSASGTRPRQAYFERSYVEMSQDCGLSVLRLRQVERTALDKLRGFLGRLT